MNLNPRNRILIALGVLLLIAGGAYAYLENMSTSTPDPVAGTATTTESVATSTEAAPENEDESTTPPTTSEHGYGTVTIRLNEAASFPDGLSIRPTAVVEDSRCPANVTCIQAGTIRVSVRTRSAMGVSTNVFKPGSVLTTEAEKITLVSVSPEKIAGQELADADYRFTFRVEKRTVSTDPGPCYVGGCSGQLCTDQPNAVSTCEYQARYACYKGATCERQSNGQCGWTETEKLRACLINPPSLDEE